MRVLLILAGSRTCFKWVSPPLGILQLAGYLRNRLTNLEIRVVDQRATNYTIEEVVSRAAGFAPDVVGISCTTSSSDVLGELSSSIRGALPKALLMIGGPHASAFGAELMDTTGADCVVIGEGELTCEHVLRIWQESSRDFSAVPGLVWRSTEGECLTNPGPAPVIQDLDTLPFPAYDLIDVRSYWRLWSMSMLPPPRRYVSMFTSRGCPYRCIYCHEIFGKRFRAQSPERIVAEMEHYVRTYGIKEVEFFDDIFNLNGRRVIEFSELVRRRNLRVSISFPNAIRADILTPEVADALAAAGTHMSALALETGSPRIQELIQKRLNIPRYMEGVAMLAKRRVFTYGFVMFGFPTETAADMQMTVDMLRGSKLHALYSWIVTPYPKTELFDMAMRLCPDKMAGIGYAGTDYFKYPCVNLSEVSDEVLAAYMRKAYSALFLNPFRALRIVRDFPRPWSVVRYAPGVLVNITRSGHKYSQTKETAGMRSGNGITGDHACVSERGNSGRE
jgi:anaerobic magnesium-protoporphyrin IX monomethyl ester cyclase